MHVEDKRFGCKIIRHNQDYAGSDPTTLRYFSGFKFEAYMKWRWYFRYLTAKYQLESPKLLVEVRQFNVVWIPPAEEKKKRLKNKLRSAKAKVTEWSRKLEEYKANHNSLFPAEDHPRYKQALEKVEAKRLAVEMLKKELSLFVISTM